MAVDAAREHGEIRTDALDVQRQGDFADGGHQAVPWTSSPSTQQRRGNERLRRRAHRLERDAADQVLAEGKGEHGACRGRIEAARYEVEELRVVERADRRAVAALHVVHVDLELRARVDLRQRREQQVAHRLARIGAARGGVHDDSPVAARRARDPRRCRGSPGPSWWQRRGARLA